MVPNIQSSLLSPPRADARLSAWMLEFASQVVNLDEKVDALLSSLTRIEEQLFDLHSAIAHNSISPTPMHPCKEWYTPTEVADLLGKRPYTIREHCRLQRINARKRPTGRGEASEWEISADEIERYKNHGLLPIPTKY